MQKELREMQKTKQSPSYFKKMDNLTNYKKSLLDAGKRGIIKKGYGFSPEEMQSLKEHTNNVIRCILQHQQLKCGLIESITQFSGLNYNVSYIDEDEGIVLHDTEVSISSERDFDALIKYLESVYLSYQSGTMNIGTIRYGKQSVKMLTDCKIRNKEVITTTNAMRLKVKEAKAKREKYLDTGRIEESFFELKL